MSRNSISRDERFFQVKMQLDVLYFAIFILFNFLFTIVQPVPWLSILLEKFDLVFFIEVGIGVLIGIGFRVLLGQFVSNSIRREIAPVHEEYIFRVLLLGWLTFIVPWDLRIFTTVLMLVISSFLFSRSHPDDFLYFKERFVAGIIWGIFFIVTGNYWACMVSHLAYNLLGIDGVRSRKRS
jgi:membrane protease YdiL (CAAX protease family)